MARTKKAAKPKKDYILKSKNNSFIERDNRTTISAIIAIVAVVIIVATVMKVQPFDIFGTNSNLQGKASGESFVGTRYVELTAHEALEAKMSMGKVGMRTYSAYLDEKVLVISWPGGYSQAILTEDANAPGIYYTEYADDNKDVDVVVVEPSLQLILGGLFDYDQSLALALVPKKVHDGILTVAGEEFYFQLSGYELAISYEGGRDIITLSKSDDGMLEGNWWWKEANHKVLVNPIKALAIIYDLY